MLFGTVRVYHLFRNRNGSGVTEQAAENSKATIEYKPILANFWIDPETGLEWFTSHDMTINQDGSVEYQERQVGCFTSEEPRIVHDDENGKDYLEAECAIPREYTHAASIIEREGGTKGSVELLVNACSYNAKDKYLELTDVEVSGYTLLGKNPNTGEFVQEGMVGSKLQLKDFAYSEEEPVVSFSEDQMNTLIESLDGLKATIESFNKNNEGKEEDTVKKKTLNEENENLNENGAQFDGEGEGGTGGETGDETGEETGGNDQTDPDQTDPEPSGDDDEDDDDGDDDDNSSTDSGSKKRSLNRVIERDGLKFSVNFEISHEDIRYALYNLISGWDEEDNDWYCIDKVYDGKFVASGFWSNQIWGAKYTVDGDNVNLDGERYALHAEYVTDDELASLNEMRANYSSLQEKVAKYELAELNAKRDEILNDGKYAKYQEAEEFKTLRENKENYSLEDLKTQCELAFAAQFDDKPSKKQSFAADQGKDTSKKQPKMFGFLQKDESSSSFLDGLRDRSKR